jgi:hypothetical protein
VPYRGDYIRGYARGDPGIFSSIGSFLGGAVHAIGGLAKAAIGSVPVIGGPASAVIGALESHGKAPVNLPAMAAPTNLMMPSVGSMFAPRTTITAPVGSSVMGTPHGGGIIGPPVSAMGGLAAGGGRVLRPSGKGYYTKRHLAALARGLTRARPRMNPFNPTALRRASRRAHAFLRMARKLTRYYVAKQPKGKAYIRGKKK